MMLRQSDEVKETSLGKVATATNVQFTQLLSAMHNTMRGLRLYECHFPHKEFLKFLGLEYSHHDYFGEHEVSSIVNCMIL